MTLQPKAACRTSEDTERNGGSSSASDRQGGADTCTHTTVAHTEGMRPECTGPWTDSLVLGLDLDARFVQDEASA